MGGYFFLQNGWVVRSQEADHQLIVSGNLYPIPETANLFTSTLGDFQVIVGNADLIFDSKKAATSSGGVQELPDLLLERLQRLSGLKTLAKQLVEPARILKKP